VSGVKKRMVCVDCWELIIATIVQAQKHGWTVWVGGSRCKRCSEATLMAGAASQGKEPGR
jgi:dissimilatory sulfite reductase (desulfoviridin) alpha/beta subunit